MLVAYVLRQEGGWFLAGVALTGFMVCARARPTGAPGGEKAVLYRGAATTERRERVTNTGTFRFAGLLSVASRLAGTARVVLVCGHERDPSD